VEEQPKPNFQEELAKLKDMGMPEGLTELESMVAYSSELYNSHVTGGFTSRQALYLVASMLTGSPGTPPN
jgi:hypothetical protein